MSRDPGQRPLGDHRERPDMYDEPDFAEEFTPSPADPANQPEDDPDEHVYGQAEGYERPTGDRRRSRRR
ncbi:hypothetical protein ACIBHY_39375 [Nonomuraea sp. NPDC050547]|uniref:hypothetical protein n=1 Tax=Nonomuraea sp. NPDC050547 TaxID=3364368 RepID=UPI0037B83C16